MRKLAFLLLMLVLVGAGAAQAAAAPGDAVAGGDSAGAWLGFNAWRLMTAGAVSGMPAGTLTWQATGTEKEEGVGSVRALPCHRRLQTMTTPTWVPAGFVIAWLAPHCGPINT